jgi:hypothetical protein
MCVCVCIVCVCVVCVCVVCVCVCSMCVCVVCVCVCSMCVCVVCVCVQYVCLCVCVCVCVCVCSLMSLHVTHIINYPISYTKPFTPNLPLTLVMHSPHTTFRALILSTFPLAKKFSSFTSPKGESRNSALFSQVCKLFVEFPFIFSEK